MGEIGIKPTSASLPIGKSFDTILGTELHGIAFAVVR
jgi:hypothetical protein